MKPAMISFMGLDGSGKSTSINYVYEQLKSRGYKVEIVRAAYVIKYMSAIIKLGKKSMIDKISVLIFLVVIGLSTFTSVSTIVLVIGAGDGGVIRELCRYDDIAHIDMVEALKSVE